MDEADIYKRFSERTTTFHLSLFWKCVHCLSSILRAVYSSFFPQKTAVLPEIIANSFFCYRFIAYFFVRKTYFFFCSCIADIFICCGIFLLFFSSKTAWGWQRPSAMPPQASFSPKKESVNGLSHRALSHATFSPSRERASSRRVLLYRTNFHTGVWQGFSCNTKKESS